jgi:hypothetical protein
MHYHFTHEIVDIVPKEIMVEGIAIWLYRTIGNRFIPLLKWFTEARPWERIWKPLK